jgi:hypothetical protein
MIFVNAPIGSNSLIGRNCNDWEALSLEICVLDNSRK